MSVVPSGSFSTALRTPHALAATRPHERQYATYLYQRSNLYYFRCVFPDDVKAKVGNSEIRLSLKTGYLREAKRYAAILTGALKMAFSGDCMLTYEEIRSKMQHILHDLSSRGGQQLDSLPQSAMSIPPVQPIAYASFAHLYQQNMMILPSFMSLPESKPVERVSPVLFSQAMEKYIQEKRDDGKWKEHSLPNHKQRLVSFLEIMGDMPVSSITDETIREFRNTLRKLPPNRSKSKDYAGKSIAAILAMNPKKTLDVKTVNITVEAIASLLGWCVNKQYIQHNPGKGLQIKDKRQAIELRDPFSLDDLERIFLHPKFSKGQFKHPAYFWIPLIGLYTGMRLEEIAQLYCTDVYESSTKGIWVFDINENGIDEQGIGKTLKNTNATRLIPIHNDLLKLGILDYHKSIAGKGHKRLFPELVKTEQSPKYGKQPSKQFKSVVSAVLKNNDKKSFHSLRHTFANFYKQNGLQTDIFRQLYGHEIEHLSANQYGGKFPPDLLYREVISKLDYGLNLTEKLSQSIYCKKR